MPFSPIIYHNDFTLKAATDISKAQEFASIVIQNQHEFRFLPHTSQISTVEKARAEIKNFKDMWDNNGSMFFYFIFDNSDIIVGSVGIKVKDNGRTAEGCYWLDKTETGKGYATKALQLIEKTVFEAGYHRFEILCDADNLASVQIPERLNYHLDATLREADYIFNRYHDILVFSKLNSDDIIRDKIRIININGPINSGKSTVSKLLKEKLSQCLFIEVDELLTDSEQEKLKLSREDGWSERLNRLNKIITQEKTIKRYKNIIFAYPITDKSHKHWKSWEDKNTKFINITLGPELDICIQNRGTRSLTKQEKERIRQMYQEGYNCPQFADLIIDNSTQTPEETVITILDFLNKSS